MPVPRPPTPRYLPDESAEEDEISQLSPLYDAYDRRTFIPFKKVKDAFLRMLGFGDRLDAVEAAVETKQNKLTAGDNITITEDDVISATPPEQIQSDWDVDDTEDPAFIKNKPDVSNKVDKTPGVSFDLTRDGAFAQMAVTTARILGMTVTGLPSSLETPTTAAAKYVSPTDSTTFGDLEAAADLTDTDTPADLINN